MEIETARLTITPFVDRILDNVYIGNGVGACDVALVNEAGITGIVCMALEYHPELLYSFPVIRAGMRGDGTNPEADIRFAVDSFTRLVNGGNVVLSHCHAGCDRSVSVVAAWLIVAGYTKTMQESIAFINERRLHKSNPNAELIAHMSLLYDVKWNPLQNFSAPS